jgi:hypothetical protein
MKIAVLKPGEKIEVREIENKLEDMQAIVGGDIETFIDSGLPGNLFGLCNETGKFEGNNPPNFTTPVPGLENAQMIKDMISDIIFGTVFFTRSKNGDFTGVTDKDVEILRARYDDRPKLGIGLSDPVGPVLFKTMPEPANWQDAQRIPVDPEKFPLSEGRHTVIYHVNGNEMYVRCGGENLDGQPAEWWKGYRLNGMHFR